MLDRNSVDLGQWSEVFGSDNDFRSKENQNDTLFVNFSQNSISFSEKRENNCPY